MSEPILDLSIETLMKACKGNVKNLPSFMVHDNAGWVTPGAQLDNQNRIHLRRATFLATVCEQLPVRPGLWLGPDVQEFFLDLKPHHLQGSEDMVSHNGHAHSRVITRTDAAGRNPGDEDYGDVVPAATRLPEPGETTEPDEIRGGGRGVKSAAIDAPDSE